MAIAPILHTAIGNIQVFALNDFSEAKEVSDFFPSVTAEQLAQYQQFYPNRIQGNSIVPWTYCCYLIQDGGQNILIDAGVGGGAAYGMTFAPSWNGSLLEHLQNLSIKPEDIHAVVYTHLHRDHVGWGSVKRNGIFTKTFPRAVYYAHKSDYEAYQEGLLNGGFSGNCFDVCVRMHYENGDLRLLTDESFSLTHSVTLRRLPSHTPGSMYAEIRSGGDMGLFVGDILASPLTVTAPEHGFLYDAIQEPEAAQRRALLVHTCLREEGILASCHFGIGRVISKNNLPYWEELSVSP